jgi:hypothetical protein
VQQLATWARQSTPVDAVFLFPDAGKDLSPGIFRQALRGVRRLEGRRVGELSQGTRRAVVVALAGSECRPRPAEEYRKLGIDYLVLRPGP